MATKVIKGADLEVETIVEMDHDIPDGYGNVITVQEARVDSLEGDTVHWSSVYAVCGADEILAPIRWQADLEDRYTLAN